MEWKPKYLLILLLIFLLENQTSSTVLPYSESNVESYIVDRKPIGADYFFVKSNPLCRGVWCGTVFSGTYRAVSGGNTCECECTSQSLSFVPSRQTCSNATTAADFGGCLEYFHASTLLGQSFDLTKAKSNGDQTFRFQSKGGSCHLTGSDFHDYNSFQSKWIGVTDGFFNLSWKGHHYEIEWKQDTNNSLSGRIIRLNITCTNYAHTRCFLFKAQGKVTYYAPVSSSTSSTYTSASQSGMDSQVSFLSTTSSLIIRSTSQSPQLPLSSSSSLLSSSSVVSATPSTVSLAPSLVVTSLLQPSSSQTTRLPAMSTPGKMMPTSETELQSLSSFKADGFHTSSTRVVRPIKPSKTTSAVSGSSTAGIDDPGGRETQTGGDDKGVVIGAAVGGVLVLGAVVIIIIFVFWKRRRAEKSPEKEPTQVKNPVYGTSANEIPLERSKGSQIMPSSAQDNPLYQGLVISNENGNGTAIYSNPEGDYDNCNVYQSLEKEKPGSPVYQSLNASQGKAAHTTSLPKNSPRTSITDAPNSKATLATGTPKSKPGATGNPYQKPIVPSEPVYNVVEGQDGEEDYEALNGDSLYNILEGPDATCESSDMVLENSTAESDPVCNVVEEADDYQNPPGSGPSTAQEPLYNVLQDSNAGKDPRSQQSSSDLQDEPVYNILEESDSGARPSKPCPLSGHDNPTYEQTLEFDDSYAAVHRPGPQRESLYEPLREPSQDLYAPLG